jgi:proteasome lid subunit RPN8/RPN11
MALIIAPATLDQIRTHGEAAYPEEGAGLLLGVISGGHRLVTKMIPADNAREAEARHNRYLLTPEDYQRGEAEASRLGVEVLGAFHSHPDHPNQPSEFDLEWALPTMSYLITTVQSGKAADSRSWQLNEDRSKFVEESIQVLSEMPK